MFEENPCRWNPFEVFQIDPSNTDVREIRERERLVRSNWELNEEKIKLPNGEMTKVEEARLNDLHKRLNNPLLRLQEEQYAHRIHSFASDDELLSAVSGLAEVAVTVTPPAVAGSALVNAILPLLPSISPEPMADDLPWPDPPAPLPVKTESLEDAVLRDC